MTRSTTRRRFLRDFGLGAAALPFILNLPGLGFANQARRKRFASLEFGVMDPDRADTWTRMVYAGPNKPIAPIDDPYQMFARLYGQSKDRAVLGSILDDLHADLKKVSQAVGAEDRRLL